MLLLLSVLSITSDKDILESEDPRPMVRLRESLGLLWKNGITNYQEENILPENKEEDL